MGLHFISIKEEHLELILNWRTSEFVTRHMYTDIDYDLDKQNEWLKSVQRDQNSHYWVLNYKDQPIGLVSITDINYRDKRAYWNFYIGDPAYGMLGGFIGPYVYNYAFEFLGIHKLMGEVMEENEGVRKLHLKQGAREVGYLTDHIYKYGKYHNVYIFEMTKEMWKSCGGKFAKYFPTVD
ncbi:UDP-4-amino-4,6-dideoxy-N-acetyl-beta-L-altrosamine N-acetyltransferase [Cytobacillus firmus]|uniref:UDP-4-amino-4, 6-dideoxy-N-acetyl-beta-L-altrosamine N-acetyltransferase n=1 Tax=Cytobacillus firmus TaxID=1399 RepID=UPI00218949FC|nr:UDP-4-amino-4,6-dideoxy-N-acetyl-beta-L-altrosamine N-acetyltransferase [Cytobacillus firmus]URM34906.1 UDP-4-amino-4,6-dideoxy-N-acetyl-beta-L-altrosamine N-acetyltransferase [Cytobacillus firmus]